MKCGNCKGDHETVAQVKGCYGITAAPPEIYIEPEGKPFTELSEKQYNYINTLRIQHGEKPFLEGYEQISATQSIGWAKWEIKRLLAIPKTSEASALEEKIRAIPEGRYAVESLTGNNDFDFYKIDKPIEGQWAGFTFVKMIVGGNNDIRVKGARRYDVLKAIAEVGHEIAALCYAKETNTCRFCGLQLTKYASRKLLCGPVCAEKKGMGEEWNRIQFQWDTNEAAGKHDDPPLTQEELAGLNSRAIDDEYDLRPGPPTDADDIPFEATLDHDEHARFARVTEFERIAHSPEIATGTSVPGAVRECLTENDPESATWD